MIIDIVKYKMTSVKKIYKPSKNKTTRKNKSLSTNTLSTNTLLSNALSLKKLNNINKQKPIYFNLSVTQIEFILLYSSIINHILLLTKNNIPKNIIKKNIINLLKELRNHHKFINKNTSDKEIDTLFEKLYNQTKIIQKHINKEYGIHNTHHKGGFYFKSLEEKGDQPLTGADLSTLLDEMQQFFYNAQYTDEGKFLQDTNALISMLRGDLGQFKGLVRYRILPQYYSIIPPFLNFRNIKQAIENKKYEDLPDYLLAYQSYLRSRDEYLVGKGLKSPNVLSKDRYTGFFDKLAKNLDKNVTQFQQYRNKMNLRISPISLPA